MRLGRPGLAWPLASAYNAALRLIVKVIMPSSPQEQFDDAMYDFSMAEYDAAIGKLRALLEAHPDHFDARLALGMAYCRQGDLAAAIEEGHRAEAMRPHEQLVHTNLSLFYVKTGDKQKAEHHGLQARIASWRDTGTAPPSAPSPEDADLKMAGATPAPTKFSGRLPEMPWKKNKKEEEDSKPGSASSSSGSEGKGV